MKNILIFSISCVLITSAVGQDISECEGARWVSEKSSKQNGVMMRKCNLFGVDFVEVKDDLPEDRCVSLQNAKTHKHVKDFYLAHGQSKAVALSHATFKNITVVSSKIVNNSCRN
jgi:hypothetical protein